MLQSTKRKYIISSIAFLFLCFSVFAVLFLVKSNQDIRQQAAEILYDKSDVGGDGGSCEKGDSGCVCDINGRNCKLMDPNGEREVTDEDSDLRNKGIVATSNTAKRDTNGVDCGGVWMNNFCYMPGDELSDGSIVVAMGRYNRPYIENREIYESGEVQYERSENTSCDMWGRNCIEVDPNSGRKIVEQGGVLNNKGILATSFTGNRPTNVQDCGGVWMNNFCYMPGDELGGGYVVAGDSSEGDSPFLQDKETYEELQKPQTEESSQIADGQTTAGEQQKIVEKEGVDALNQAIGEYRAGSLSGDELKKIAMESGFITDDQAYTMSTINILTYIYESSSELDHDGAVEKTKEITSTRNNELRGQALVNTYLKDPKDIENLESLYKLTTGKTVPYRMNSVELAKTISDFSPEFALNAYLKTNDIAYLKENYAEKLGYSSGTSAVVPNNPEVLLKTIFGEKAGSNIYKDSVKDAVLPRLAISVNDAINNFAQDPDQLESVCTNTLGRACNIDSENASEKLEQIFKITQPDKNAHEMAVAYSNQLFAQAKEEEQEKVKDFALASHASSQADLGALWLASLFTKTGKKAFDTTLDYQLETFANLELASQTVEIFNVQDTFEYASQEGVRANLSNYTWGTTLGNALMYDDLSDREYELQDDLGLSGWDAASMTGNQIKTQFFNVTNNVENIATNYAGAVQSGYTGPVNTNVADLALQSAENLGVLDYDYQEAQAGHYFQQGVGNVAATITDWTVTAGKYTSLAMQTQTTPYSYGIYDGNIPTVDYAEIAATAKEAGDEAGTAIRKSVAESLAVQHNQYNERAETGAEAVDLDQYISFQLDKEIVRSRKELNWETVEKVVAPVAAVIVLPAAIASGAGLGVVAGVTSSVFSLYQGAGIKAQALELDRVIISDSSEDANNRKNIAALALMESSTEEITYEIAMESIDEQIVMLEKQGNMMVASSAVAALTSGAGVISGFQGAQTALTTSMGAAGRVGGIGLSSYNMVNSGQQAIAVYQKNFDSFGQFTESAVSNIPFFNQLIDNTKVTEEQALAAGQVTMSGLSSFVAGSGVVGNTFGFIRNPALEAQKVMTRTDLILDIMNVPAGVAIDAQNVSQSCFNSDYPADADACRNAWIGLAISVTQDLAQVRNSTQARQTFSNQQKIGDYAQKISLTDQKLTELMDISNRSASDGLEIVKLISYRQDLANEALAISPNLVIPDLVIRRQVAVTIDTQKMADLAQKNYVTLIERAIGVAESDPDLSNKLTDQAVEKLKHHQGILDVNQKISEIDQQIRDEATTLTELKIEGLRSERQGLVEQLDSKVNNPDFKAANLEIDELKLVAQAKESSDFKNYDLNKAIETQVDAATKKETSLLATNVKKRSGAALALPGSVEYNKSLDLIRLDAKIEEVGGFENKRAGIQQNLTNLKQADTDNAQIKDFEESLKNIDQKIAVAKQEIKQIAPSTDQKEVGFFGKLMSTLTGNKNTTNLDNAISAKRLMFELDQQKVVFNDELARIIDQDEISQVDLYRADEIEGKLKNIDQRYADVENKVLGTNEQAKLTLYSKQDSRVAALLTAPLNTLKKSFISLGDSLSNIVQRTQFDSQKAAEIKNDVKPAQQEYDDQAKSKAEVKITEAEIEKLAQEQKALNEQGIEKLSDQDKQRLAQISAEIKENQTLLEIKTKALGSIEEKLSKPVLSEVISQRLIEAEKNGELSKALDSIRNEEVQRIASKDLGLNQAQQKIVLDLIDSREIIAMTKSSKGEVPAQTLATHKENYTQKMTELTESILGRSPHLADSQQLNQALGLLKNIDLLDLARNTNADGETEKAIGLLGSREATIPIDNDLLSLQLENIVREIELRTGATEGFDFFNTRTNQMDTLLKILQGERVAVELTTSGGKTFVGAALLKVQTDILGYDTGIYVAKPGQEADIQLSMMRALGLEKNEVVILDHSRLNKAGYVESLSNSKFIVTDPSNVEFIRNSANNFNQRETFKVANQVYKKLTQNATLYIDELQITLDPSRQAINSVGASTDPIPKAKRDAARAIGEILDQTLLKNSDWGLGKYDFLITKNEQGAEIALFSDDAQKTIFDSLAQKMGVSADQYELVKNNAAELERISGIGGEEVFTQKLSDLGVKLAEDQVVRIFDEIDMVNSFAQGLKMKAGTDYVRMKDSVLAKNGGVDRKVTVPAAGGVANEGQSYKAKLQAVMEYVGAKSVNEKPNFKDLTASPNLAYKSTIGDYIGDLRNSAVGAVTGALADGKGVVETALGLDTYRSTVAVEKILGLESSSTGGRINSDNAYPVNRTQDAAAVIALKRSGVLDFGNGINSKGNLKVVLGFDGAKIPVDFATEMARSGAFDESQFAVQNADGSYSLVKIDSQNGDVNVVKKNLGTKDVQALYETGETNLVTIIGRGGATGDSILTGKNVPGITVTSFDSPEGLVAQAGARIDRSNDYIADQYALIVRSDQPDFSSQKSFVEDGNMKPGEFLEFRNKVTGVQIAVEQAKNTEALDQGVLSSSTRVLSDLIRNSDDARIQKWASEKLLEFSTDAELRNLDLTGGSQESIKSRRNKIAGQVELWKSVFEDGDNGRVLKRIERNSPEIYDQMKLNAQADSQKLTYAGGVVESKESVMTAANLGDFIDKHSKYVTADSENQYVADSGRQAKVDQIAVKSNQNTADSVQSKSRLNSVNESIKGLRDLATNMANPLKAVGESLAKVKPGELAQNLLRLPKNIPTYISDLKEKQKNDRLVYEEQIANLNQLVQQQKETDDPVKLADIKQEIDKVEEINAGVSPITKVRSDMAYFYQEQVLPTIDQVGGLTGIRNSIAGFFNAIIGNELPQEVKDRQVKIAAQLSIDAADSKIKNNFYALTSVEEIDQFVSNRLAAYEFVRNQFSSLNTKRPSINNEEEYQVKTQELEVIVKEIEDLQQDSKLAFVEMDDDGQAQKNSVGGFVRDNQNKYKNLSDFRKQANSEIARLAAEEAQKIEETEKAAALELEAAQQLEADEAERLRNEVKAEKIAQEKVEEDQEEDQGVDGSATSDSEKPNLITGLLDSLGEQVDKIFKSKDGQIISEDITSATPEEKARLELLAKDYGKINDQVQKLNQKINDAKLNLREAQEKENNLNEIRQNLDNAKSQSEQLQSKLEELRNQRKELSIQSEDISKQINSLSSEIRGTVTEKNQALAAQRVRDSLVLGLDKKIDQSVRGLASQLEKTTNMSQKDANKQISQIISDEIKNFNFVQKLVNGLRSLSEFQNDIEGANAYAKDILSTFTDKRFISKHMAADRLKIEENKTAQKNIIAIGDVHGDWNAFVRLLSGQVTNETGQKISKSLIDKNGNWIGGENDSLIITGDLFDRAPNGVNSAQTAERIMRLQQEAGDFPDGTPRVKVLLGNHDVNSILAYWNMRNLISEKGYSKEKAAKIGSMTRMKPGITVNDLIYLYNNQKLVNWVMNLDAMTINNGTLYMHSDIIGYNNYGTSVKEVNNKIRSIIQGKDGLRALEDLVSVLTGRRQLNSDNVSYLLRTYDADHIVHGHSQGDISHDSRVDNVDGGLSEKYSKRLGLGQNRGRFYAQNVPGVPAVKIIIDSDLPNQKLESVLPRPLSNTLIQADEQSASNRQKLEQFRLESEKLNSKIDDIDLQIEEKEINSRVMLSTESDLQNQLSSQNIDKSTEEIKNVLANLENQLFESVLLFGKTKELLEAQKEITDLLSSLRGAGIQVGAILIKENVLGDITVFSKRLLNLIAEAVDQHTLTSQNSMDRIGSIIRNSISLGGLVSSVNDVVGLVEEIQTVSQEAIELQNNTQYKLELIKEITLINESNQNKIVLDDDLADMDIEELEKILVDLETLKEQELDDVEPLAREDRVDNADSPKEIEDDEIIDEIDQNQSQHLPDLIVRDLEAGEIGEFKDWINSPELDKKMIDSANETYEKISNYNGETSTAAEVMGEVIDNFVKNKSWKVLGENILPNKSLKINENEWLLVERIFRINGKNVLLMYAKVGENFIPRVFYKSESGGIWRGSPGVEGGYVWKDPIEGHMIEGDYIYAHYVQTGQLDPRLSQFISNNIGSFQKESVSDYSILFRPGFADRIGWYSFGEEIQTKRFRPLESFAKYEAGYLTIEDYGNIDNKTLFDINFPENFIPDFSSSPEFSYKLNHAILGEVTYELYGGAKYNGEDIKWLMAKDNEGRVWVSNVFFSEGEISTYGTSKIVIDCGILTSKPLDYSKQVTALDQDIILKSKGDYVDITPVLSNLKPIRDYKEAKASKISSNSKSFSDLCSSCSEVRELTKEGLQEVDALFESSNSKAILAELKLDEVETLKSAGNKDEARKAKTQAKNLKKDAEKLKKQALSQIHRTRKEVVNKHGMQNQCVQLYLNAWVNTREAKIRQTKNSTNKAIDSVYQATIIAKDLLIPNAKMKVVERKGFLGIGKKTKDVDLTIEDLIDIRTLLEGDHETLGLEEMVKFGEIDGELDRKNIISGVLSSTQSSNQEILFSITKQDQIILRGGDLIGGIPIPTIVDKEIYYKLDHGQTFQSPYGTKYEGKIKLQNHQTNTEKITLIFTDGDGGDEITRIEIVPEKTQINRKIDTRFNIWQQSILSIQSFLPSGRISNIFFKIASKKILVNKLGESQVIRELLQLSDKTTKEVITNFTPPLYKEDDKEDFYLEVKLKQNIGYRIKKALSEINFKKYFQQKFDTNEIEVKRNYKIRLQELSENKEYQIYREYVLEDLDAKDIVNRAGLVASQAWLPKSESFSSEAELIAAIESSYQDSETELGQSQRTLVAILNTIDGYKDGPLSRILEDFLEDSGGDIEKLPEVLANLLAYNLAHYKAYEDFWQPVLDTYNNKVLTTIKDLFGENAVGFGELDLNSIVWLSLEDQDYNGKGCSGACTIETPIQDNNKAYMAIGVEGPLAEDVYEKVVEGRFKINKIIDGKKSSKAKTKSLHTLIHEGVHEQVFDLIGLHNTVPLDSISVGILEELTEKLAIIIHEEVHSRYPEIDGENPVTKGYPQHRHIGSGIVRALEIDEKDIFQFAMSQDVVGYIQLMDNRLESLSNDEYNFFANNLLEDGQILPSQREYLRKNRTNKIVDVRQLMYSWRRVLGPPGQHYVGGEYLHANIEDGLIDIEGINADNVDNSSVIDLLQMIENENFIRLDSFGFIPKTPYSLTRAGKRILEFKSTSVYLEAPDHSDEKMEKLLEGLGDKGISEDNNQDKKSSTGGVISKLINTTQNLIFRIFPTLKKGEKLINQKEADQNLIEKKVEQNKADELVTKKDPQGIGKDPRLSGIRQILGIKSEIEIKEFSLEEDIPFDELVISKRGGNYSTQKNIESFNEYLETRTTKQKLDDFINKHKTIIELMLNGVWEAPKLVRFLEESRSHLIQPGNEGVEYDNLVYKSEETDRIKDIRNIPNPTKFLERLSSLGIKVFTFNLKDSKVIAVAKRITDIPDDIFDQFIQDINNYPLVDKNSTLVKEDITNYLDKTGYEIVNPRIESLLNLLEQGGLNGEQKQKIEVFHRLQYLYQQLPNELNGEQRTFNLPRDMFEMLDDSEVNKALDMIVLFECVLEAQNDEINLDLLTRDIKRIIDKSFRHFVDRSDEENKLKTWAYILKLGVKFDGKKYDRYSLSGDNIKYDTTKIDLVFDLISQADIDLTFSNIINNVGRVTLYMPAILEFVDWSVEERQALIQKLDEDPSFEDWKAISENIENDAIRVLGALPYDEENKKITIKLRNHILKQTLSSNDLSRESASIKNLVDFIYSYDLFRKGQASKDWIENLIANEFSYGLILPDVLVDFAEQKNYKLDDEFVRSSGMVDFIRTHKHLFADGTFYQDGHITPEFFEYIYENYPNWYQSKYKSAVLNNLARLLTQSLVEDTNERKFAELITSWDSSSTSVLVENRDILRKFIVNGQITDELWPEIHRLIKSKSYSHVAYQISSSPSIQKLLLESPSKDFWEMFIKLGEYGEGAQEYLLDHFEEKDKFIIDNKIQLELVKRLIEQNLIKQPVLFLKEYLSTLSIDSREYQPFKILTSIRTNNPEIYFKLIEYFINEIDFFNDKGISAFLTKLFVFKHNSYLMAGDILVDEVISLLPEYEQDFWKFFSKKAEGGNSYAENVMKRYPLVKHLFEKYPNLNKLFYFNENIQDFKLINDLFILLPELPLEEKYDDYFINGVVSKELMIDILKSSPELFVSIVNTDLLMNIFDHEVVQKLLDSLPTEPFDERRNAFTHNKYDRTTQLILYLFKEASFQLDNLNLEILGSYVSEFGLSKTNMIFNIFKNVYLFEHGKTDELPSELEGSEIRTISELKDRLLKLKESVLGEPILEDLNFSSFEEDILDTITGKSTHSHGGGGDTSSLLYRFFRDIENGSIKPTPVDYTDFSIPLTKVVWDGEILREDRANLTDLIELSETAILDQINDLLVQQSIAENQVKEFENENPTENQQQISDLLNQIEKQKTLQTQLSELIANLNKAESLLEVNQLLSKITISESDNYYSSYQNLRARVTYQILRKEIIEGLVEPGDVSTLAEEAIAAIEMQVNELNQLITKSDVNPKAIEFNQKIIDSFNSIIEELKESDSIDKTMQILVKVNFGKKKTKQSLMFESVMRQLIFRKLIVYHQGNSMMENLENNLREQISVQSLTTIIELVDVFIKQHMFNFQHNNEEKYWTQEAFEIIKNNKKNNPAKHLANHSEVLKQAVDRLDVNTMDDSLIIEMIPDRGLIGEMSGYLANACYTKVRDMLKNYPNVVPYKFIDQKNQELVGSVLIFELEDEEKNPVMLIRAFNYPNEVEIDIGTLFEKMVGELEIVAKSRGIKKILVPGNPHASSNYSLTNRHLKSNYIKDEKLTHLSKEFNFNGYELKDNVYIVRDNIGL